jgi:hypothetical protein
MTGAEEKKTGPSRFNADFSSVTLDAIYDLRMTIYE